MTKDVLVSILGLQMDVLEKEEGEHEAIEVITPALYYLKNGKHFVLYDEVTEGVAGITKNKIKIYGEHLIEMVKSGAVNVSMSFEKGKRTLTHYSTPLGQLLLGIRTRDIRLDVSQETICVEVNYLLEVNDKPFADCEVKISIQSENARGL